MPNSFLWIYYTYLSEYKTRPVDLDDMLDGLRCIRAQSEIKEILAPNGE